MNVHLINKIQIHNLIFLFLEVLIQHNLCRYNPRFFKLIADIHIKKIPKVQDKALNVSHSSYVKLISKQACKSSSDSYKYNFPCDKFLFNRPRCELYLNLNLI